MKYINKTSRYIWVWMFFFIVTYTFCLPAVSTGNKKKFEIELYGGLAIVQPKDFNQIPETDKALQLFLFDRYNDYLLVNHEISAWSRSGEGDYGSIKNGLPFGLRLKYHLSSSFAVSVGFKYLLGTRSSDPTYEYERHYGGEFRYQDAKTYDQYNMSVNAFAPMVGFHLEKKVTAKVDIAGYIGGGPLWGRCHHKAAWTSTWRETTNSYSIILYEENGSINLKGTGLGIAVEGGLKVNYRVGTSWGLFIEGLYAYQKIGPISGSGTAQIGNSSSTWEGEWGMKQEDIISLFIGNLPLEYPTNLWSQGATKARDFNLDLSGFECRIGVAYRF